MDLQFEVSRQGDNIFYFLGSEKGLDYNNSYLGVYNQCLYLFINSKEVLDSDKFVKVKPLEREKDFILEFGSKKTDLDLFLCDLLKKNFGMLILEEEKKNIYKVPLSNILKD